MEVTDSCFLSKKERYAEPKNVLIKEDGQRQITDAFSIDVNRVVISDKVPCNNGLLIDRCYIIGYQVDGGLVPLFIKTLKNIFSYGVLQYNKNSACTMLFNVSEEKGWVSQYKKIWNEVESQLFEKLATEPIKGSTSMAS